MRVFARWIKNPFYVAVQSAQHPGVCMHHEVAALGGADQTTDRCLPFLEILLSLW